MTTMKLYKLSQDKNTGWHTWDAAVVAAENEDLARFVHPMKGFRSDWDGNDNGEVWCNADDVVVEHIGEAKEGAKRGVVVASFNTGCSG